MNNLRTNTSGQDCVIKSLQTDIYNELSKQFDNVEGYGRVYRNNTDNGVIPEVFISGDDYGEVFLNDTQDVTFSFITSENHSTNDGQLYITEVKAVFWFNLEKLDFEQRNDSEAQRIVSVILNDLIRGNEISEIQTGLSNIFNGFNIDDLKYTDMQPYHCFSINFDIQYYLTKKCS